jgi:hypothetical protein
MTRSNTTTKRVTFSYLVPVCVEVEDDIVRKVVILDEASVDKPKFVEGNRKYLKDAVEASSQRPRLAGLGVRLLNTKAPSAERGGGFRVDRIPRSKWRPK